MAGREDSSDSDGPIIDDNIIKIQLRKPCQRKWELRTRNLSQGNKFPTIQLFDCDGNLLVETNDENISIKSSDFDDCTLKSSQSLKGLRDYRHYINKNGLRKHNTISGDKVYTRVYRIPKPENSNGYIINDGSSIVNIPSKLTLNNNFPNLRVNSLETTPFQSEGTSDISSYKSSDNETCEDEKQTLPTGGSNKTTFYENGVQSPKISKNSSVSSLSEIDQSIEISLHDENETISGLHKSKSFNDTALRASTNEFARYGAQEVHRSKSGIVYHPPHNKVSFLNTYLKSLPARMNSNPDWFTLHQRPTESPQNSLASVMRTELPKFPSEKAWRVCKIGDNTSDNEFINIPTDVAADCEMKKRLKMYRRGISEIETRQGAFNVYTKKRSHSVSGSVKIAHTSSSESVDEADVVLNRLKRRILKNKMREKRRSLGEKFQFVKRSCPDNAQSPSEEQRDVAGGAYLRSRHAMGSNISQHSTKGLKGRRARSSGDLCNGDSKSQTESSVCGSVVGDVMGWNRSLPNHLDGNRHLADYSRVNNNYGDFATYNRSHPKGGRGLRYRVCKSGSDAEPVWKLQDPGFDQGYGSERSPEDDYVPPIAPAISLEAYESELRTVYPFINDAGKIDAGTLRLLSNDEIAQLIPVPGDRARFKANLANWKTELKDLHTDYSFNTTENAPTLSVGDLIEDDPSFASILARLDPLQETVADIPSLNSPPSNKRALTPLVPASTSSSSDRPKPVSSQLPADRTSTPILASSQQSDYVLQTLKCTHDGKAILNQGQKTGKLDDTQRNLLVKLLIGPLFEDDPNVVISNNQLLSWALQIQDIFPNESAALFYTPYVSALVRNTARNASGKLLRYVYNRRRQLREKGIIEGSSRSRSSSSSQSNTKTQSAALAHLQENTDFKEVEEKLLFLKNSLEPWHLVEEYWTATANYRLNKNYSNSGTLQEYFDEYPVLRQPAGYNLLLRDFDKLHRDKSDALFINIVSLQNKVIELARKRLANIRDKDLKQTIESYLSAVTENTFTVVVEKDGRGLGMSVCGGGGLVKIRRLYPPQPAWRTGRLAPRDLLLSANGVPLAGLSTYEALEVLRTAPARVELRVCRPPPGALESVTPPDPPTPPARTPHPHLPPMDPLNCHPMHARLSQTTSSATTSSSEGRGRREASPEVDRHDLRLPDLDQPLPVYNVQYGEFDIVMTKVNGSLGFTLRKEDHSALGHYVRALVREPALSDGRIQPGDRIVAVNDTPMSNMSHAEAVAFLRACGAEVRLRLYRDHAATPLSPMSPKEEGPTDSDGPMNRPKPPLRPEAVSMLCDLAARRLTPDMADGSRSPCLSPRKFRKLTKETNHYEQPNDPPTNTVESEPPEARTHRAHTVTLASPTVPPCRKQKLSLTVPPHGYELNNLDNEALDAPNVYQEDISRQRYAEPVFPIDSDEPVSMPAELSSDERFKHSSPAYQSAVLHTSSDSTSDGHKDDNGLKKWKGVALSPENERKVVKIEAPPPPPPLQPSILKETDAVQKENIKPENPIDNASTEPTIVTVELNRGWNSRLGFSVQSHPDSGQSYISAVYSDSVAARDGRLRRGDVILQVNDENVTSMKTPEVIDLLRILRGSICITVLRPPNPQ